LSAVGEVTVPAFSRALHCSETLAGTGG
jgi:hypothetical protein